MRKEKSPCSIIRMVLGVLAQAYKAMIQTKTLIAVIVCACAIAMFDANVKGADITWQAPTTISGTSDVSTLGTLVGTWAPGDDAYNPDSIPVNGVTFNAYGSGPFNSFVSTSGIDAHYTGYNSPGTADNNYNTILKAAVYSNGSSISLTWGGMTPGNTYLLEFWVQDGRNSTTAERSETLTGGANTSAALAYGFGDSGPGQFIIGTFVADDTGTQTITLNASGGADIGASAQVNLMQLRNLTARPSVAWLTPVTISGSSDVTTQGTYFGSWAPSDGNANTLPVNGVTFQKPSDLPFFTEGPTFDSGYSSYNSPGTTDPNYNTLLQSADYSNSGQPATFSWSGMTPGKTYLVQLWVHDGRNSTANQRTETITGGANTSDFLAYGSGDSGPGQYIIGTFVADRSQGQTLILSSPNGPPQINLFQVRDITPIITGIAVSGTTLTITATNGPANGNFVLLQSADVTLPVAQWTQALTGSFDASGNVTASANVVNPGNPQEFYILRTQ